MNTRLITPDGFPRADLDVAQSMFSRPSEILGLLLTHLQFGQREHG
jgi:hypothetical protein